MRLYVAISCVLIACAALQTSAVADCAGLMTKKFPDTKITKAETVASGAFTFTDQSMALSYIFHNLPAYCRVVATIHPTADSEIGFELWLPDQWNGRYLQVAGGGFEGIVNYGGLVPSLRNGFAVAGTDDGHRGDGAAWALGHPEKIIDYGYRAVHLTSVTAKEIASAYYNRKPSYAYFDGCSDGGRESLMEAQRYPDDFDGWVVGAPANNFTGVMTYFLNLAQTAAALKEPLGPSQLEALSKAALARCDAADGVKDGVIDEPLHCTFDPGELLCKGASDGRCLSMHQVAVVRKIYDDSRTAKTQASLTPGFRVALGGEVSQWPSLIGPVPKNSGLTTTASQYYSDNFWPFMVYNDPKLDAMKLDLLQAAKDGRSRTGMILNSVDPARKKRNTPSPGHQGIIVERSDCLKGEHR